MKLTKGRNNRSGFVLGRRAPASAPRTYVVLGAPRGGTSLIAGALRLAGVFMGERTDPANNEDMAFNFHGGNVEQLKKAEERTAYLASIRRTIAARNATHRVWGWKDPLAPLYIEEVLPELINPHIVFVTRDINAAIMRERIEAPRGRKAQDLALYFEKAWQAVDLYSRSLTLIRASGTPALFVSYEKACQNREDFASQLLDFAAGPESITEHGKAALKAIALFTRSDTMSADLAHRPIAIVPDGSATENDDLANYKDLPAVYHRCATLVNLRHYAEGASLARRVLAHMIGGFESYPNLRGNPVILTEVEAGLWFMVAVAQINLGDGYGSYISLNRFFVVVKVFRLLKQKSDLIDGLTREATTLLRQLEHDLCV